jgi:hypothetical protein
VSSNIYLAAVASSSKRKESATPQPGPFHIIHVNFELRYGDLDSPKLKKRRIIESDDEEDPNNAPAGIAPI